MEHLERADARIFRAVQDETGRQLGQLEMIASENFVSPAVREALGTVFTHKYAEGLPGRRYYGGCEFADEIEELARSRATRLFGADHANVQPHSGAQANMAAYFGFLEPGDTILGMNLSHGGHLTHGSPVNFSGRLFKVHAYGVRQEDGRIDYDQVREVARRCRPKLIMSGASAYPRTLDFAAFGEIAAEVGAVHVVDLAHIAGLVAGGHHPSPVPHADVVTTTTHKTLRGPRGGLVLCRAEHARIIDRMVFPFIQGGPLMHVVASKAVALGEALTPAFRDYGAGVIENARVLARTLLARGVRLVSGGTDTHLLLVDLKDGDLTGKDAEQALERAGITVNKNTVPGETRSPFVTSGLRIGTPALTTRGMGTDEMRRIAGWIADILERPGDTARIDGIRGQVTELCRGYPLYA
ncbi:MAG: serine hydroxymethyltransferase [Gemmatimonadetes bacterium]|nr:serine hydroxymethyltransferase [Gemmatimonadota bacterium]MYE70697.1 serine hydroxymethyltransferase [Gemmatimonadota bacterium]MYJ70071.1 serine hydroxymethyltransferase [Gemmatimonadota bacterium]